MPVPAVPLTVSVALCTHNGGPFVAEQVSSILDQSVAPDELVVSDDASTDATVSTVLELVARFRAQHPEKPLEFTLLQNATALGVTANFEQAVLACRGDIVVLSDQDDVWEEHRIARLRDAFGASPDILLLHSDASLVDANGEDLGELLSVGIGLTTSERAAIHEGRALDVLLRRNVVTGATAAFRRDLVESAVPFPPSWVHDEWLAMVAALTGRIDFVPQPLVRYRQHDSNQIGAGSIGLRDKMRRLNEPRATRNARLLARARALDERFQEPRVSAGMAALLRGKLAHEQARSALPRARLLRVCPILREWLRGGYGRFGRARYDVARDLLQPAGD